MLCVAAILILIGVAGCYLFSWYWLAELFTHFRVQLLVALLLLAGLLALVRHVRWAIGVCVAAAILGWPVAQLSWPVSTPGEGGKTLKLLSANVLYQNEQYRPLESLVQTEQPDILVVVECTHGWRERMESLRDVYPYQFAEPRSNGWGIALVSKLPLIDPRAVELSDVDAPALVAGVELGGQTLHLVGVHLLSPLSPGRFAIRNRQLESLSRLVNQLPGQRVVIGDFNATTWSPYLARFLRATGLRDSRQGFGVQASWPDRVIALQIPIDHLFVSDEVVVHDRRLGPSIASDHLPVISTISIDHR
jgi:endonuclease/exonuclease/phosphatase (EEP) superfamily protein YafD